MTAKLSAEELDALQRLTEGEAQDEWLPVSTLARLLAQVREAEARWSALKPFVNSSGRADNVLHQIRAEMARLEKERTA